jgi:mannan endo-1,4-beta-mannosidase
VLNRAAAGSLLSLDDATWPLTSPIAERPAAALPRLRVQPGAPYFVTEHGEAWTPIGHNDAVTWPELAPLFRRRDVAAVERHLIWLRDHGVTCIRLMLEYCHGEHRYIERPAGRFVGNMVTFWDDLFALLEKVGLRVLLTPVDTFFMWIRWRHHPYNRANGGPCASRRTWLTCPDTRAAFKQRLAFASDRWGGSPALFAWDLWNEIHPAHGGDDPATAAAFIDDVAPWLRAREIERRGFANLQTVSVFGPELINHPALVETIFRHPALDFANTHLYEHGTIDAPRDTVAPALAVARLMRAAVENAGPERPVFDSEHGPIHSFKDKKRTLSEAFDNEYFRHIAWSHLASGGAGGGMRWPNRHPHVLTTGMREAQRNMGRFLPLIDWARFRRRNLNDEMRCDDEGVAVVGCGDASQAIAWLVRTDALSRAGTVVARAGPPATLTVPGLDDGAYSIVAFDTADGSMRPLADAASAAGMLHVPLGVVARDLAIAVRRRDTA